MFSFVMSNSLEPLITFLLQCRIFLISKSKTGTKGNFAQIFLSISGAFSLNSKLGDLELYSLNSVFESQRIEAIKKIKNSIKPSKEEPLQNDDEKDSELW